MLAGGADIISVHVEASTHLQRTLHGEYYHWHVDAGPGEFSQRQLVAIWYLNDVPGPGGETEFPLIDQSIATWNTAGASCSYLQLKKGATVQHEVGKLAARAAKLEGAGQ